MCVKVKLPEAIAVTVVDNLMQPARRYCGVKKGAGMEELRLPRPGDGSMTEALAKLGEVDASNPAGLIPAIRLLDKAFTEGFAVSDSRTVLHELLDKLECLSGKNAELATPPPWARRLCSALGSSFRFRRAAGFLDFKDFVRFYKTIDELFSHTIPASPSPTERQEAVAFVRDLPLPATETAAQLLVPCGGTHDMDRAGDAAEVVGVVLQYSTSPALLRRALATSKDHAIRCADALGGRSTSETHVIEACRRLDEILDSLFGRAIEVRRVRLFEFSASCTMRFERMEFLGELDKIGSAHWWCWGSAVFAQGFRQYLRGRVFALTGKPRQSRRCLDKAMALGFSPQKVAPLLVAVLLSEGRDGAARDVAERTVASLMLQSHDFKGTEFEKLARLYEEAGGELESLVHTTDEQGIEEMVHRNRKALDEKMEVLQKVHDNLREEFWTTKKKLALKLLGDALSAEDYDCALRDDTSTTGLVRLNASEATEAHLDELDLFSPAQRETMVRSVAHGIEGSTLARIHFDVFLGKGLVDYTVELDNHKGGLGTSVEAGKAIIRLEAKRNLRRASIVVDYYKDKGLFPQTKLADLVCTLVRECVARLSIEHAVAVGQGYLKSLTEPTASDKVREAISNILLTALKVEKNHEDRKRLVATIKDIAGNRVGAAEQVGQWLEAIHPGLVTSGREKEARELVMTSNEFGPDLGSSATLRTRDALLKSLRSMPVGESPLFELERLAELFRGDEDVEKNMANWFTTGFGRLPNLHRQNEAAAAGEWLARHMRTSHADDVVNTTSKHLEGRLKSTRSIREKFLLLARLSAVKNGGNASIELQTLSFAVSLVIILGASLTGLVLSLSLALYAF